MAPLPKSGQTGAATAMAQNDGGQPFGNPRASVRPERPPHQKRSRQLTAGIIQLRNSTYIDPQTGAKLRRTFTLHSLEGRNGVPGDDVVITDTTPLLAGRTDPSHPAAHSRLQPLLIRSKEAIEKVGGFVRSDTGKGVFKCALAYLLGSLATFLPPLSNLLGRNDSKHLVATITVYFHPARSLGSMLEALLLASAAFLYTAVVSVVSMSVTVFFADVVHLIEIGYTLDLVIFIGGGLGLVGWYKLKKNDPLVNIACSLTGLSLITILTKEGAVQAGDYSFEKIWQILKMIVTGVIATMLVSFFVFPISGRQKLRQNLVDVTDSLADMLALITSSFLSGDESELESALLYRVSERHQKVSTTLPKNLKEAKYEHYLLGTERQALVEAKLVHCVQRIGQSIGGLRSAAAMQFVVTKQQPFAPSMNQRRSSVDNASILSSVDPFEQNFNRPDGISGDHDSQPFFNTPSQIFELFIQHLGPSMRSLAFTLKEILDDLPFDTQPHYAITTNSKFQVSLDRALELYRNARKEALKVVYDQKDLDGLRPMAVEADWEDAAACCGHFSFSLVEVAEQVKDYLVILDEMQLEFEELPAGRTWTWLKFWQSSSRAADLAGIDPEFAGLIDKADELDLFLRNPAGIHEHDHSNPSSPWSGRSRFKQIFFGELYKVFSFFRRDDIKFAIKVGLGAMLFALPSFIDSTRPIYARWRGEWGLLSYMLVCSMTIGASNTTGYSRILGTCLGACLAIAAWEVSDDNPFILGFFGFCMAYWTAYIIIGKGKGPMGRFIMLTYNLSALYAYSLTAWDDEDDGDEEDKGKNPLILAIAGHRVVAVVSGTIWGLIITRAVWPISARQKLKDGLSLIWLRMGLIWKRDPLSTLTEGEDPIRYMNLREEFELERFLTKLQGLVEASKNEFELRGPFPHATYNRILKSTGQMLDAFHAMNVVITKDLTASAGEEALLQATTTERTQLCKRISHLFGVLASSMKLEYPIANDALPNIDHTRDRLLAKIFTYRRSDAQGPTQKTSDEDYSLLYTYALVTGQLSLQIQNVLKEVESLFGVLDEEALRLQ